MVLFIPKLTLCVCVCNTHCVCVCVIKQLPNMTCETKERTPDALFFLMNRSDKKELRGQLMNSDEF